MNSESSNDGKSDVDLIPEFQEDTLEEGLDEWHAQLEEILLGEFADQAIIKSVCKCRSLPSKFRLKVWQICLNVSNRGNRMLSWDGNLDLQNQEELKKDCTVLVKSQDYINTTEQQKTIDNLVSVITFYCKCRCLKYESDNGWTLLLKPFLTFSMELHELYNCFYAVTSRYIHRSDISINVKFAPYHILCLLLMYHDPELCSFLDTCKISMQMFATDWFSTLFANQCTLPVTCAIWDIYFQQSDPYFVFFLSLVILVNSKEQILTNATNNQDKEGIIQILIQAPSVLTVEDVEDFCQLANYYSDRTPCSFKKNLTGCFYSGMMVSNTSKVDSLLTDIGHSLCLKVSIAELLLSCAPAHFQNNINSDNEFNIRFFVVDCRPAKSYNKGHLFTAFHLDATLMLSEPEEFNAALNSLFAAQDQAIQAGSDAAGEHLCFIGSGVEEEDQYMHMVIANLLQKQRTYVSVTDGGYDGLLKYFTEVGIDVSEWIVGADRYTETEENENVSKKENMESLVKKMAGSFFEKSLFLKEKVTKIMENAGDEGAEENEGTSKSKHSAHIFSIGDESEHTDNSTSSNYAVGQVDKLSNWKTHPEFKHCFECQSVKTDGMLEPGFLLATSDKMYFLLHVEPPPNWRKSKRIFVQARSPKLLCTCIKITSKRSFPELISFKFGELSDMDSEDVKVVTSDRYIIPDAGTATKAIKLLIVEGEAKRKEAAMS